LSFNKRHESSLSQKGASNKNEKKVSMEKL